MGHGEEAGCASYRTCCNSVPYLIWWINNRFLFFIPVPSKTSAKLKKKGGGGKEKKGRDAATRQDKHNSKAQSDEVVH